MKIPIDKDCELNVTIKGEGTLIAMIPAVGRPADDLNMLSDFLSTAGYRTAQINVRGINGSTGDDRKISLPLLAEDVAKVIESLTDGPAHVFGHCFGGRVARLTSALRPDLVKSVIPLTVGGLVPAQCDVNAIWDHLMNRPPMDKARQEKIKLFFSESSDSSIWYFNWDIDMLPRHLLALVSCPDEEWITGGTAPMLIIQGFDDLVAPPQNGDLLMGMVGDRGTLLNIPDAGHQILHEQPNVMAEGILDFLKKRDQQQAEETKASPSVSAKETAAKQIQPDPAKPEPAKKYALGWGKGITKCQANRSAEKIAEFFLRHLTPDMKILDAGCGPGSITADLAEILPDSQVVGIDVQPKQIDYANSIATERQLANLTFETGDLYRLPYSDNSYDAVFMCTVLMNLDCPLDALNEIHRILKPGGIIGITDGDWGGDIITPTFPIVMYAKEMIENKMTSNGADYRRARYGRAMLGQSNFVQIEASAMVESYGTADGTKWIGDIFQMQINDMFTKDSFEKQMYLEAIKAWSKHPDAFFSRVRCQVIGRKP